MKIAIITARGGSKRIPRKNIRYFCGKRIILYSIEVAMQSELFDEIMVSTDDDEIAAIAREAGAKVPFMRSEKASNDHTGTAEVLIEVLEKYRSMGDDYKIACCLYPTAPFITVNLLKQAYEALLGNCFDTIMPVVRFSFPILRSMSMDKNKKLVPNWPEYMPSRSQDLLPAYHDAGQFYFIKCPFILEQKKLIGHNTGGIEIPETLAQDIDTEEDWKLAEMKYQIQFAKDLKI